MNQTVYGEQLVQAFFNGDLTTLCDLGPTLQDYETYKIDPVVVAMTIAGDVLHKGKNNWLNEALNCLVYIHSCFPGNPWGEQYIDLLVDLKAKTILDKIFSMDPANCTTDNLNTIVHKYFDPDTFKEISEVPPPEDIVYTDDVSYSVIKHKLGYEGICGMIETSENIRWFRTRYSSELRSYDEGLISLMDNYFNLVRKHLAELKQAASIRNLTESSLEGVAGGSPLLRPRNFSIVLTKLPLPFKRKSDCIDSSSESSLTSLYLRRKKKRLRSKRRLSRITEKKVSRIPDTSSQEITESFLSPEIISSSQDRAPANASYSEDTEDDNQMANQFVQTDGGSVGFQLKLPNNLLQISASQLNSQEYSVQGNSVSSKDSHTNSVSKFFQLESISPNKTQLNGSRDSTGEYSTESDTNRNMLVATDSHPDSAADDSLYYKLSPQESNSEDDAFLFTQIVDVGSPSDFVTNYSHVEIEASESEAEDNSAPMLGTVGSPLPYSTGPFEENSVFIVENSPAVTVSESPLTEAVPPGPSSLMTLTEANPSHPIRFEECVEEFIFTSPSYDDEAKRSAGGVVGPLEPSSDRSPDMLESESILVSAAPVTMVNTEIEGESGVHLPEVGETSVQIGSLKDAIEPRSSSLVDVLADMQLLSRDRGKAGRGKADRGKAGRGKADRGKAGRGKADRGKAGRGKADRGKADRSIRRPRKRKTQQKQARGTKKKRQTSQPLLTLSSSSQDVDQAGLLKQSSDRLSVTCEQKESACSAGSSSAQNRNNNSNICPSPEIPIYFLSLSSQSGAQTTKDTLTQTQDCYGPIQQFVHQTRDQLDSVSVVSDTTSGWSDEEPHIL